MSFDLSAQTLLGIIPVDTPEALKPLEGSKDGPCGLQGERLVLFQAAMDVVLPDSEPKAPERKSRLLEILQAIDSAVANEGKHAVIFRVNRDIDQAIQGDELPIVLAYMREAWVCRGQQLNPDVHPNDYSEEDDWPEEDEEPVPALPEPESDPDDKVSKIPRRSAPAVGVKRTQNADEADTTGPLDNEKEEPERKVVKRVVRETRTPLAEPVIISHWQPPPFDQRWPPLRTEIEHLVATVRAADPAKRPHVENKLEEQRKRLFRGETMEELSAAVCYKGIEFIDALKRGDDLSSDPRVIRKYTRQFIDPNWKP